METGKTRKVAFAGQETSSVGLAVVVSIKRSAVTAILIAPIGATSLVANEAHSQVVVSGSSTATSPTSWQEALPRRWITLS